MRLDLTLYATTRAELQDALANAAAALPENLFAPGTRLFRMEAWADEAREIAAPVPEERPLPAYAPPAPADVAKVAGLVAKQDADAPPAPKRTRRTKAEMEAAADAARTAATPGYDDSGDRIEDTDADATDTDAAPDVLEALGEQPEPDDAAAKVKAMDVLRDCFALTGGAADVRRLMASYDVPKFAAVPDNKGRQLLRDANAMFTNLSGAP